MGRLRMGHQMGSPPRPLPRPLRVLRLGTAAGTGRKSESPMFTGLGTALRLFTPETHPHPLCLVLVLVLVLVLALAHPAVWHYALRSTAIYTYLQLRSRWRCLNPNYSEPFLT